MVRRNGQIAPRKGIGLLSEDQTKENKSDASKTEMRTTTAGRDDRQPNGDGQYHGLLGAMKTDSGLGEVVSLRQAVVSLIDASDNDVGRHQVMVLDRLFAVYTGYSRRPSFRKVLSTSVASRFTSMARRFRITCDPCELEGLIEEIVGDEVVRLASGSPEESPESLISQARSQVQHSRRVGESQPEKHPPWSFYAFLAYRACAVLSGRRGLPAPGPEPFDADAIPAPVEAGGVHDDALAARGRLAGVLRVRELAVAGLILSGASKEYVRDVFGDRAARDAMALATERLIGMPP